MNRGTVRLRQGNPSLLTRSLVLLTVGGLLLPAATPAFTAPATKSKTVAPAQRLSVEQSLNARIKSRLAARDLANLVADKQWTEISLEQALQKALGENITLARSAVQERIAEQSKIQADAVFDSVLSASIATNRSARYHRGEIKYTFHKPTTTCPECETRTGVSGGEAAHPVAAGLGDNGYLILDSNVSPIWYMHFTTPRPNGLWKETYVEASKRDVNPAMFNSNYNVSLTKPLPWGADAFVAQQTSLKRAYFTLKGEDTDLKYGSYGRPWAATIGAGLQLPLPLTKEFGPDSSRETGVKQGALGQQQAALRTLAQQNGTLQEVEQSFWNLVGTIHGLEAAIQNRHTVAELVAKTDRLLAVEKATQYSKSQVDTQLAQAINQEAVAADSLIMASNALNQLLNFERSTLFLPIGYSALLADKLAVNLDEALAQGQSGNFEIQTREIERAIAELTVLQRNQLTRPDLKLNVNVSAAQSNRSFGRDTYFHAMQNLTSPDSVTVTTSLAYRYPWLNRGAEANLGMAQAEQARLELVQQETANRVNRQVMNAYVSLKSARERINITKRNMDLAATAYAKAAELQEERLVTEYEILVKSNDLLQARLRYVQSQVYAKKAEASLLAAMGAMKQKRADNSAVKPQAHANTLMQTAAVDPNPANLQGNDHQ